MKTTKNFKRVALFGILTVAAFGGYQNFSVADSTDLSKLVTISNAYATEAPVEGGVKCGDAGSGCKYTVQVGEGAPTTVTSQIAKEYVKPAEE